MENQNNTKSLKILFVCIGNSCRSPMAECVMSNMVTSKGLNWEVDSAGLRSWNAGRHPEERCIKVLSENGLKTNHLEREITKNDFCHFDFIFGMDENNINELNNLSKSAGSGMNAKIELLGSYIERKEDEIIPDPYFGTGLGGFRSAYQQIFTACKNLIETQENST